MVAVRINQKTVLKTTLKNHAFKKLKKQFYYLHTVFLHGKIFKKNCHTRRSNHNDHWSDVLQIWRAKRLPVCISRRKRNGPIENNGFEKYAPKKYLLDPYAVSGRNTSVLRLLLLATNQNDRGTGRRERSECYSIRALACNTRVILYRRLRETIRCNKTSSVRRHDPRSRNAITRDDKMIACARRATAPCIQGGVPGRFEKRNDLCPVKRVSGFF